MRSVRASASRVDRLAWRRSVKIGVWKACHPSGGARQCARVKEHFAAVDANYDVGHVELAVGLDPRRQVRRQLVAVPLRRRRSGQRRKVRIRRILVELAARLAAALLERQRWRSFLPNANV